MDAPKAYSELTSELAWHAMSQIVDGTPLKRVVEAVMDATIEWHRANRIGKKEPEFESGTGAAMLSDALHAQVQLRQERDTLSAALTASEADVETLKQRVKDYEGDNHRLVDENHQLKNFNAELHEENNLLRKADESLRLQLEQARSDWKKANESLNEAMNSLSKERKRAEEAEKQRDHHLQVSVERYHEINGLRQAPEVIKREMNDLVQDIAKQRDEYKARLGVYVEAFTQLQLKINMPHNGEKPCEEK